MPGLNEQASLATVNGNARLHCCTRPPRQARTGVTFAHAHIQEDLRIVRQVWSRLASVARSHDGPEDVQGTGHHP